MLFPSIPLIPKGVLNWGSEFSEKIKEEEPPKQEGAPLTPEEEQQIADELDDDPLFTKEENALIRQAKKEAEEKRKKDEEDIAIATKVGEMQAERNPSKLKQYKEEGYQLDPEQERIAWKYERDMPATRKVGDFLKRGAEGLTQASVDLPVGAYKTLKYGVFDPIGAMDATPEEEAKVLAKAGQTARSVASGFAGGLEDVVYELPKTIYKGGTPVTDWAKELVGAQTEEESYQNYLNREAARKEFAAEEEAMPERTSALLAKGTGVLGDVGLINPESAKNFQERIKKIALTKEQMVPEAATLGDVFAPDIPLMGKLSKFTGKVTGKIGEGALRGITGVQAGNRRIGIAPAVESVGWGGRRLGEKINEYSSKIDRALSGSDDWIFRNAVGKTSNFLGRGAGGIEAVGRFGTDIGRVLDTGIAGRKGVAERLGELPTQGRLANIVFGDASQAARKKLGELSPVEAAAEAEKVAEKAASRSRQGLARARAVDSASRLAQYYSKSGINGAAVQVMLGLPNMETWGDVGEATGYGAGMGFVLSSNPKSLLFDRVRADQRVAAEADISRMMENLDETTKERLKSLSDPVSFVNQLTKRKESVQSRLDFLKEIVGSAKKRTIGNITITPRDAQVEIDHIEKEIVPKLDSNIKAAANTNPQTQKEIEFIINKEFMDSLGNLQSVAEGSGVGDVDVRMLGTDEITAAIDEMYKSQSVAAAEVIKTLGGQENLSPEDKKLVDDAIAFQEFLAGEKENLSSQRGFALTPAKDRTQTGWWQAGAPVSKPTIIMNSDELKNSRGLDISEVMRHEMFHALLQFGEVQERAKEYTDILFDQYTTDPEGNTEKINDGIISDEKLRQMADKYSAKYNPLEKGMWRSMFESDADLLNAIKEEFLAEAFTQSGGATGMTSNVEDSVVESVLDYARAQNSSSTLGKIRDALGKMGISIDNSGRSNVLESEIPSQAIALMRHFRRALRDYNGTLNQVGQTDLNATGSIPLTKIASSKALFNRYKDADYWEREAATTITAPDGTVLSEEVLPKSAQDKLVAGEWVVQNGKLVPVDPEYTAKAPAALAKMAKGKPDGTKIVAGVRIAMNADGTPRILSPSVINAVARKRSALLKAAIDDAPDDGTPNRFQDTGNGNYRGVMSPSQLMAISQIPDIVLPPKMKTLIRKINEMLLRGDGSRFNIEYQAALRGGGYRAMAPRFSDEVPIGFQFSKDGNFLVTTVSVTRLHNKLNAWAKEMPGRLTLWDGSKYDFWADFVKVIDNQRKNLKGETDLDPDPQIALEKKNVINDLLNLYNKDTVLANPSRTKLKVQRGQDSRDRTIVSRRLDRMLRLDENNAEKLPINYGKVIANALPQAEFNFGEPTPGTKRFYQDFEILNKSGEYAGQPVRISVQAKSAEEADKLIRQTPDYQRYNSAYRFNSIGEPYARPEPSERATAEDFAQLRNSNAIPPSAKALPASIYGTFYHGTNNPENLVDTPEDFEPTFYGYFDPVEVVYVAPEKIDAQKFGDSTLKAKLKSSNIFDPSSKEDLKKFKESAIALIKDNYDEDVPGLEDDYAKRIENLGTNKYGGWSTVQHFADIIKDAGFDGYIAWEFENPQIGLFPDRVSPDFEEDSAGYVRKPSGKVDFAKALPREITGNPTFWSELYHYTDKDSAKKISVGGFDIAKSGEERLFPKTISLTTKDSWNVGDAAVLNELSADNPIVVRVSGKAREGEISLYDFASEGEEVSPMELGQRLVDWAAGQGHDVIVARGVPGPGKEYAVLDPSKIKVKTKALPKQDLSQVMLDERKAKLPKYKTINKITSKRTNGRLDGYYEIDGSVELADPENNDKIGSATYSIFGDADSKFGRSLVVGFSFVNDKYISKGYGEGLYRELAKIAQKHGATEIVGETSPEARKVRNKLFPELTTNWEDAEGKNDMVSQVNPSTKYLPKQDLSQVALDERKAKLPKYRSRINFGGRQPYIAIYQDNDKGIQIGKAEYFIERGIDDVVTMFIESSKVDDQYRNKGYGEALYRELAKLAQSEGVTRIEGLANKDAVKVREKLFEKKPDPLGLDMNRIDLINPSTKYLPKSEQDFYSRLQRGIAASQQSNMSPEQAKSLAKKSTNQEELKWSGIEQAIDNIAQENNGKVPKQALLDYMNEAGNVEFEEVILAENTPESYELIKKEKELDELLIKGDLTDEERQRVRNLKFELRNAPVPEKPKYGPSGMNKVIPGGENYREIVLKMPYENYGTAFKTWATSKGIKEISKEAEKQFQKETGRNPQQDDPYISSHYANIPNYVAHIRLNDRIDSDGKKGLFIEEIQSDRHQQGRKRGYTGDETFESFERWASRVGLNDKTIKETWKEKDNRVGSLWYQFLKESGNRDAIPDAPFRQSRDWGLALFKRALRDAVASGKEWIGLTDGEAQADRYDLSQHVDKINVESLLGYPKGYKMVNIFMKDSLQSYNLGVASNGSIVSGWGNTGDEFAGKNITDIIGKDLGEKIISEENPIVYEGVDLKIGGEGMKGFYDKILPTEIGKYVGKMGGKVEKSKLRIGEEYPDPVFDIPEGIQDEIAYKAEQKVRRANPALDDESSDFRDAVQELQYNLSEDWAKENGAKDYKIWRINITPEMRKLISSEGQPKFLPQTEQQSSQQVKAPKERGLQFLKYAEEEEEPLVPLSSLMLN